MRAPAPPTEEFAARSNKAPGTATLPRSGMSRRSPNPTSCAATASAHVGQGHPTRIEDVLRMRSGRPPPLTRRPLPCRALIEAAHTAGRDRRYRPIVERMRARHGRKRGSKIAAIEIARRQTEAIWHMLTENRPFAPAGAPTPLAA